MRVFVTGGTGFVGRETISRLHAAGHEICSHGYRWIDYQYVDKAIEREHMQRAIRAIEDATGERPLGWYTGRTSPNTRALVVEEGADAAGCFRRAAGKPLSLRTMGVGRPEDFDLIASEPREGDTALLYVIRGGTKFYLTLKRS